MNALLIRDATTGDWLACEKILRATFSRGDTYPYPGDMDVAELHRMWFELPARTFVAVTSSGEVVGTYYIKANQAGRGDHVCNCGYVTAEAARGMGVATAMCEHSQNIARELGFKAMQFNFVVATNTGAVALWQKLGFRIIGTLPRVFRHAQKGFVDAHIMFKEL